MEGQRDMVVRSLVLESAGDVYPIRRNGSVNYALLDNAAEAVRELHPEARSVKALPKSDGMVAVEVWHAKGVAHIVSVEPKRVSA